MENNKQENWLDNLDSVVPKTEFDILNEKLISIDRAIALADKLKDSKRAGDLLLEKSKILEALKQIHPKPQGDDDIDPFEKDAGANLAQRQQNRSNRLSSQP